MGRGIRVHRHVQSTQHSNWMDTWTMARIYCSIRALGRVTNSTNENRTQSHANECVPVGHDPQHLHRVPSKPVSRTQRIRLLAKQQPSVTPSFLTTM